MQNSANKIYRVHGVEILVDGRSVRRRGELLYPRAKVFELLLYLLEMRERVVSKEELVEKLWHDTAVSENSLPQCVIDARKVLGDDAHHPRFIKTVPKAGYQFIAPVEEIGSPDLARMEVSQVSTLEVEYEEEINDERPALLLPSRRGLAWAAAAGILLCLAAGLTWWLRFRSQQAHPGTKTVAVLFFENQSRTPELDWLREGLADMFITSLSRSPGIAVLSRRQVYALLERSGTAGASSIRLEDALKLAARSHAELLVLGSFAKLGEKIRVGVELHDARGRLLDVQSLSVDRPEQILTDLDLLSLKLLARLGLSPDSSQHRTSLVTTATNNLEAYRNYSLAIEKSQAYHSLEAIALLEKAIALDPDFAMAHARIGYTYAVTWNHPAPGRPYLEKAFRLSNRLSEMDRLYIAGWYAIANLDFPQAIRIFRQLIAAYPGETEAYLRLGHLLRGEEQPEEAIAALKQGLVVDPDAQDIYNLLGSIYAQQGRHEEAIAMERRYVALCPGEPNAHDSLGLVLQLAGRNTEARDALMRALQINPGFEVAVIHLGNLYTQMGRYRDAEREFERYIAMAPSDFERARGYEALAWLYERKGNLARAWEAARNQVRCSPASTEMAILVALRRGDVRLAEELGRRWGPQNNATNRGARMPARGDHVFLGRRALLLNRPDEAIAQFQEALRYWAPLAGADREEDFLADAYLQLGRLDEAIAEYERVLRLYPGSALAQYHLGLAWQRRGRPDLARAAFQRFLKMWKDADRDIPETVAARRFLGEKG